MLSFPIVPISFQIPAHLTKTCYVVFVSLKECVKIGRKRNCIRNERKKKEKLVKQGRNVNTVTNPRTASHPHYSTLTPIPPFTHPSPPASNPSSFSACKSHLRYAGYFRSGVPKSKQKHPPRLESSRSCRYSERWKESALGVFVADSATELVCGATRFGDSVGRPPAAEYVRTRLLACRLLLALSLSLSLLHRCRFVSASSRTRGLLGLSTPSCG